MGNLLPGTLLFRKDVHAGLVDHYGVILQTWPCYVAHIDKAGAGHLNVKVESYEQFAAGLAVNVEPVESPVPLEEMWCRVQEVARTRIPYGMLCWGQTWNCESFARYVKSGLPESKQASDANVVLGIAAAFWGLAFLSSLSDEDRLKYDLRANRYRDKTGRFASKK